MDYKITVHSEERTVEYHAPQGANLLRFLKQNNYEMYTPCNGHGSCGKCRVKMGDGVIPKPSSNLIHTLGEQAIADGYRLACQTTINNDLEVYLDSHDFQAKILTDGKPNNFKLAPSVLKKLAILSTPNLDDQRSDLQRLADLLPSEAKPETLHLIRQLPDVLRNDSFKVTLIFNGRKLIGLESGDTTTKLYGVAVDIGTTTIAAYLLDMHTGKKVATYSCLNPQSKFGADVISRINHTMKNPDGLEEIHYAIIDALNRAVENLTTSVGLKYSDVYQMVCVGNTTMMHFLLKISPRNIAVSPFIPAATRRLTIMASEIGLQLNQNAILTATPSVTAYIGADTVAAILASGMEHSKNISLLIDFGTNGEIALGNNEWLLACSAAAGPAFEGANIRDGVGGVKGAIDSFTFRKTPRFTTIEAVKPIGICGSGLIDIVAELFKAGIISGTGLLQTIPSGLKDRYPDLAERIVKTDGMASFIVAYGDETDSGREILLTQKDIREFQNAKAAIAAGINVLVKKAGINFSDIQKVYLAGGFGAYINIENALTIGLIPPELQGKIESIGNAAGIGALEILGSRHMLKKAEHIKEKIQYIELSNCPDFNDFFIEAMIFAEE